MSDIAIRCIDVYKTYTSGEVETPVLRGIDLEIRRGELTVILGASGAGKTTLLNIIGGIDRPTRGEVWSGEQNLAALDDRRLTDYRRSAVGFVFQFYNLAPTLTALEMVMVLQEIFALGPKKYVKDYLARKQLYRCPAGDSVCAASGAAARCPPGKRLESVSSRRWQGGADCGQARYRQ
jgi:ABC-type lipoprotein export system ATPase subunit